MIVVSPAAELKNERIVWEMGFKSFSYSGTRVLDELLAPNNGVVAIGTYRNCQVICCPFDFTDRVFDHGAQDGFATFIHQLFPDSEVYVAALVSAVNYWGYAVIKNEKIIRARWGDADTPVQEVGRPLPEEQELFRHSFIKESGERVYEFTAMPGETFTEDQVGENFVFRLYLSLSGLGQLMRS